MNELILYAIGGAINFVINISIAFYDGDYDGSTYGAIFLWSLVWFVTPLAFLGIGIGALGKFIKKYKDEKK